MFDQLGGLAKLVAGKTVSVKVNLVGAPEMRLGDNPIENTVWTHPAVIGATVYWLGRASARRIRVLECCGESMGPFEDYIAQAGWHPQDILNAAPNVEFENTNPPGTGREYARVTCPGGGLVFPGFDLNHSDVDCDVFVSLAKMKQHAWFGVTLTMKNCYGMTPLTIYGEGAGIDKPSEQAQGTRVSVMHDGERAPSLSAPQEIDPKSPRDGGCRIPRLVNDTSPSSTGFSAWPAARVRGMTTCAR
jgi:hypothetical protein